MNDALNCADELADCSVDAALYVLGALSPENTSAFEQRLRSGCPYCSAQAEQFAMVAEYLSLAVKPVEPPADLRTRLLDRIRSRHMVSEPLPSEHMRIVRSSEEPG